jgi:hypothetical protein
VTDDSDILAGPPLDGPEVDSETAEDSGIMRDISEDMCVRDGATYGQYRASSPGSGPGLRAQELLAAARPGVTVLMADEVRVLKA